MVRETGIAPQFPFQNKGCLMEFCHYKYCLSATKRQCLPAHAFVAQLSDTEHSQHYRKPPDGLRRAIQVIPGPTRPGVPKRRQYDFC